MWQYWNMIFCYITKEAWHFDKARVLNGDMRGTGLVCCVQHMYWLHYTYCMQHVPAPVLWGQPRICIVWGLQDWFRAHIACGTHTGLAPHTGSWSVDWIIRYTGPVWHEHRVQNTSRTGPMWHVAHVMGPASCTTQSWASSCCIQGAQPVQDQQAAPQVRWAGSMGNIQSMEHIFDTPRFIIPVNTF